MKKMFATLMALCLLFTACAALADTEPPTVESMPQMVVEDEKTTVDEKAFQGQWVLKAGFAGTEYVDESKLFDAYDFNFMPYVITEGKITQDIEDGEGEFRTIEMPYTFEAGELHGKDEKGRDFSVCLLEDGNILLSVFFPGEGGNVTDLNLFLVHPEA